MYAVIKTGGKQYRVATGDTVRVESLKAGVGQQVKLSEVLAVVDGGTLKTGSPLQGAAVMATVLSHGRGDKVTIFVNPLRNKVVLNDGSTGGLYVGVILADGKTLGQTDGKGAGSSN